VVGVGERWRRYLVCHKHHEAQRQRPHCEQVVKELAAEVWSLRESDGAGHSKRVSAWCASACYGRYLRLSNTGRLAIEAAKIKAAEGLDGRCVAHSNDDTLSGADLGLGYEQVQRIEQPRRSLKSGLRLRPVYHRAVHRTHVHVGLSVLALLLERVAEHACAETWRNIRDDLRQMTLAQLSGPSGTVSPVIEAARITYKGLKRLEI